MEEKKTTEERLDDIVKAFDKLLDFLTINRVLSEYHTNQIDPLLSDTKEVDE